MSFNSYKRVLLDDFESFFTFSDIINLVLNTRQKRVSSTLPLKGDQTILVLESPSR